MKVTHYPILLCTLMLVSAERVKYDNYTLYRITPKDEQALTALRDLERDGYDFWKPIRSIGTPVDVLVPPQGKNDMDMMLRTFQMDANVRMENIQERIDQERGSLGVGDFGWNTYHDVDEINAWLRSLAQKYPQLVTLLEGGISYENRTILGVKVSFSPDNANRAVWIDSNIHAREWISGAVNTFILNSLLTNEEIRDVAESHDWYIFPVINPDGYQYTFTDDRLWRKTRTPYSKHCYGADPNRNWDYKWNQGGSSNDPCSDSYAGPKAFSERSILTLSEYISTIASKLMVYVTFHSYSQLILLPYGHTSRHLDNYNVTYPVGVKAARSLAKRYGTEYEVGNIAETIYTATGSSMDWLKGTYHVPFAYGYELRDTGYYGFLLPTEEIIPTALETLDSVLTIVREADKSVQNR